MTPIRVLVLRGQNDVLGELIADAVTEASGFALLGSSIPAPQALDALLQSTVPPDILVLVGTSPVDCGALLARHASLVIVQVHVRADAVRLDLHRVGMGEFISILRALANTRAGDAAARSLTYEVGAGPAPALGAAPSGTPAAEARVLEAALPWIDATLRAYNRARPERGTDVPGLPPSMERVDRVLDAQVAATPADDDYKAHATAARDFEDALTRADTTREPFAAMYRRLALTTLEMQALMLALAPELDPKYQQIYGSFNEDGGRRSATLGLTSAMLGSPWQVHAALEQSGNLVRWRLLDLDAPRWPAAEAPLRVDPAITAWLLGRDDALADDSRLSSLLRHVPWPGADWQRRPADISLSQRLASLLAREMNHVEWIALAGADIDGWRALVEAAARHTSLRLVRLDLSACIAMPAPELAEIAIRIARLAELANAVPVLDTASPADRRVEPGVLAPFVAGLARAHRTCVVLVPDLERMIGALPREHLHLLHRDAPDSTARGTSYSAAAADAGLQLEPAQAERLAAAFPLALGGIDDAIRLAIADGVAAKPASAQQTLLVSACRRVACPDLPRFARRLAPCFRLDDVVLPRDRREQLEEIVAHVQHAQTVMGAWGFGAQLPAGRSVAALFCGPSGTGKTMAAQAIAHALETDVYAVDLARVVSKFIGETEKNLDAIFGDAERAGAQLLFDEADALFGKRSETKDAHDRYANIEVAYLLQRMEAFAGVAILTTNFRQNLDAAFLRRIRFIVEFPKPDAVAREAIWRRCLPASAPVAADVDFHYLAKRLEVTGGNIRQITLRAAFAAAGDGASAIHMRHVLSATRAELAKLGMTTAERELAEYAGQFLTPAEKAA